MSSHHDSEELFLRLRNIHKKEQRNATIKQLGGLGLMVLAGAGAGSLIGYTAGLFFGTVLFSDYSSMSGFIGAGLGFIGGAVGTPIAIRRLSRLY